MAPRSGLVASLVAALLAAGCRAAGPSVTAANRVAGQAAASAQRPCGRGSPVHYRHVVWIWMENRSYGDIIGSKDAPYINRLARDCGLATRYSAVTHPSLPNYLAATGGSTFGVTDDADPPAHPIRAASIFGQVQAAGLTWRGYVESMPGSCDQTSSGEYAAKHNPAAYYIRIRSRCRSWDVRLGGQRAGELADALRTGRLPAFSFVTPNLCDDMHDCPVTSGDEWLAHWIPRFVASPAYPSTAVFVVWDEGTGSGAGALHVPCLVVAPGTRPGSRSATVTGHYGLLHTAERLLGLPALNGRVSASATLVALAGGRAG
jgi:phospholipase C